MGRTRSGRKVVVRREEQQRQRRDRSNNKDRVRASLDEAASLHSPLPRTPKRRSAPGRTRSRSLSPRRISAPAISTTNNDNNLRGSIKVRSKAAAPASVSPAPRGRRNRQSPSPAKPVSLNSLFAKADKDNSLSRSRHSAANQSLSRSRHSIASSSGSLASSPATPYRKSRRSRKQDSTATTQRLSTAIGRSTRRTLSGFQETLALSILLDSDKNKDESITARTTRSPPVALLMTWTVIMMTIMMEKQQRWICSRGLKIKRKVTIAASSIAAP